MVNVTVTNRDLESASSKSMNLSLPKTMNCVLCVSIFSLCFGLLCVCCCVFFVHVCVSVHVVVCVCVRVLCVCSCDVCVCVHVLCVYVHAGCAWGWCVEVKRMMRGIGNKLFSTYSQT